MRLRYTDWRGNGMIVRKVLTPHPRMAWIYRRDQ